MNEEEARSWFDRHFGISARQRVGTFLDMLAAETDQQNLVSPATLSQIWVRHAVDSAQLLTLAPPCWRSWIDVGTGGGFPGMVAALLASDRVVRMVEPRRKRADFLQRCIDCLGLENATVTASKVESIVGRADVITARAVASVGALLQAAAHCTDKETTWLLPRGSSGKAELDALPPATRKLFHVEHSLTDPTSLILIGCGVRK